MKRVSLTVAMLFCAALCASAQLTSVSAAADFDYVFFNNEFYSSKEVYLKSETLQYARFTPSVSFNMKSGNTVHSLVLGVDLYHDMGDNPFGLKDVFGEVPMYYHVRSVAEKGLFRASAGVYPRKELRNYYSRMMVSDRVELQDFHMDGAFLSWEQENFYAELALDWMGAFSLERKERFQILSGGEWKAGAVSTLGWNASMYHYAGSVQAPGVAEVISALPYYRATFPSNAIWDRLSLQGSLLFSYQRDRVRDHDWKKLNPNAGRGPYFQLLLAPEIILNVEKHGLSWTQTVYCGPDLMPFYELSDAAGNPYADNLYRYSTMYRGGFYTLTELFWQPVINDRVAFKLGARFHMGADGYRGCQQLAILAVKLDKSYDKKY